MAQMDGRVTQPDVLGGGWRSEAAARAPRPVRRTSTSPYPLTSFQPSRSIPRLPLLAINTPEASQFAESSQDGSILGQVRQTFEQVRPVAAINIPARLTTGFQTHELLKKHILRLPRLKHLQHDPNDKGRRIVMFNVEKVEDMPAEAQQYLKDEEGNGSLRITSAQVRVGYEHWNAEEVLSALLPVGLPEGTPTAFTSTGHIAHLNLRDEYAPYRFVIGQVLLDKNAPIRTVVNKLDTIDNEFRFFKMERLAGDDDYTVSVSESGCTFTFDFRTVYWNSRLHTEHARLIELFNPFDVISDVMAGVGPFAVPAAKRGCNVIANDLNPASYESMMYNRKKNRVEARLRAYCEDGRHFIRQSIQRCWEDPFDGTPLTEEGRKAVIDSTSSRQRAKQEHERLQAQKAAAVADGDAVHAAGQDFDTERGPRRRLIDHFVMNLPATAIEFLDAFRGAYKSIAGGELEAELARREATHGAESVWPMVHVHCFTKDLEHPHEDICWQANTALGISSNSHHALVPPPSPITFKSTDDLSYDAGQLSLSSHEPSSSSTPETHLHLVRSVAPNKDMYCLSFRLTRAILFDTL